MNENRSECAEGIRSLTRWAVATRVEDLPRPVLQRAVRVLADDLAAIIGARDEPEVERVHARTMERARVAEATIFRGGRARTDRLSAVVANGVAADWLELDEGYRLAPCHAGLYTVPALLAECEARDVALDDMLRALVLGYEIATRIALTWTPRAMVMQSHGRYAAVGAAAAVALARHADADLLRSALTGAVTLTMASPRDHLVSGALIRNVWPAVGAWAGTMSVEWAECGIGGVDTGFYDVYSTVHGGAAEPARLTGGLGERWAILDGYMKLYACCQHLHSTVEAIVGLGPLDDVHEIQQIAVDTHPLAVPLANPRPLTTLGAKFSLPHAAAAAVVKGSGGADAFMSATLHDPLIARLRDRVTVAPYEPLPPAPNDRPARVRIRYTDGREQTAECLSARGGPDRPFPPSVFIDKIAALTAPVYPRFVPVFQALMALDQDALAQPWRTHVERLCATAGGCSRP
jgi:2-methylcitrate dehydratase PrpD